MSLSLSSQLLFEKVPQTIGQRPILALYFRSVVEGCSQFGSKLRKNSIKFREPVPNDCHHEDVVRLISVTMKCAPLGFYGFHNRNDSSRFESLLRLERWQKLFDDICPELTPDAECSHSDRHAICDFFRIARIERIVERLPYFIYPTAVLAQFFANRFECFFRWQSMQFLVGSYLGANHLPSHEGSDQSHPAAQNAAGNICPKTDPFSVLPTDCYSDDDRCQDDYEGQDNNCDKDFHSHSLMVPKASHAVEWAA